MGGCILKWTKIGKSKSIFKVPFVKFWIGYALSHESKPLDYFLCRPYAPTCDDNKGGTFESCTFCLSCQGDNFTTYFLDLLIQGLAMHSSWLFYNYLHLMIVLWMWEDLIMRWQWHNLHHLVLPIKLLINLSYVKKWRKNKSLAVWKARLQNLLVLWSLCTLNLWR
jgi:hypothetical protein